jgi:hypothetical protein
VTQVFTAAMIEMLCPECAELVAFEQPPCVDGHGADCPEWVCVVCGTALLIGVSLGEVQGPARTSHPRAA